MNLSLTKVLFLMKSKKCQHTNHICMCIWWIKLHRISFTKAYLLSLLIVVFGFVNFADVDCCMVGIMALILMFFTLPHVIVLPTPLIAAWHHILYDWISPFDCRLRIRSSDRCCVLCYFVWCIVSFASSTDV